MRSIWKKSAMKAAARLLCLVTWFSLADKLWARSPEFRGGLLARNPISCHSVQYLQECVEFRAVPGFETGSSALFDDIRIKWLEAQLGSFAGQRVLDLGPLEGGHTCMMENAGASVVAIEGNQRPF